jgi:hypothetical protein
MEAVLVSVVLLISFAAAFVLERAALEVLCGVIHSTTTASSSPPFAGNNQLLALPADEPDIRQVN